VPPKQLNPDSQVVSEIVMKLLATAEDRYQSALGLKADLEACLSMLQESGDFSLHRWSDGLHSQFLIPQKLYGREQEVATLMDAFERVSLGATEMMLVSGYSGIGKSSLVNEVHKPIVAAGVILFLVSLTNLSGIFLMFPIQAFQELMRQLLTESADKIAVWQAKL